MATVVGAFMFAASGFYNVSALKRHYVVVERAIQFALNRSISTHSTGDAPNNLDDENLIRLGARHFQLGCAPCHGMPSGDGNPIMQEMYPAPPDLSHAASKWDAAELGWIIQNGVKFTGMPAWAGLHRQDEIWPLVAFLQYLPSEEVYADTIGGLASPTADETTPADRASLCVACHGDGQRLPVSDKVPSLSGQTAAYLRRSLFDYRADRRQSGMMEPIAAALDDQAIERLAAHFSAQKVPKDIAGTAQNGIERGRRIAVSGQPDAHLPPCLSCHGSSGSDRFPRLGGLSRQYILGQLRLFQSGVRSESGFAAIMSTVAQRLTPEQMEDVATYFAAADRPVRETASSRMGR
ncbi:c-type cytochrome [Chelativorans salis]|uniref:C-type cytochrome n=1 Tax=Chelativorans salis TaxID=2978478 RepID=A0ABT2LHZ7_9HYPH|nr:c-type cytochrome [Chelativorans sp. EGI FJ00035]MCT7373982.1 c-type cytochrome [Chelativorans sp. EGI FJ00035]